MFFFPFSLSRLPQIASRTLENRSLSRPSSRTTWISRPLSCWALGGPGSVGDTHMGLSENSVPLHPMVNDHYPYYMAIIGGIYPIFRHTHIHPLHPVFFHRSSDWNSNVIIVIGMPVFLETHVMCGVLLIDQDISKYIKRLPNHDTNNGQPCVIAHLSYWRLCSFKLVSDPDTFFGWYTLWCRCGGFLK